MANLASKKIVHIANINWRKCMSSPVAFSYMNRQKSKQEHKEMK